MADDGPAGGRGKWSEAGVPHKGWWCSDVEDLGPGETTACEMCGTAIRFVHRMQHRDFADVLGCGCICAGHMEQDLARAERRDRRMRSTARRRQNFPDRAGWRTSAKGNPTIRVDGMQVTIFARGRLYGASIAPIGGGETIFSRRRYPDVRSAQLAAFDRMTLLLDER